MKVIAQILRRTQRRPYNLGTQKRAAWIERASIAADLLGGVLDLGASIADVGCGDGKFKRELIRRRPDVRYSGFDIMPQRSSVTKLDIQNEELPASFGAVAMLGVLEYVRDVPVTLAKIARAAPYLVVSHVNPEDGNLPAERLATWTSVLTGAEFEAALHSANYSILDCQMTSDYSRVWLCQVQ
ncbi:MAG TPA: methyltransferase domain-containing protein [Allosphingosinicella sp.]|nr:methyltransferase domain-containing protein [Allosphingosinicella sp.]